MSRKMLVRKKDEMEGTPPSYHAETVQTSYKTALVPAGGKNL